MKPNHRELSRRLRIRERELKRENKKLFRENKARWRQLEEIVLGFPKCKHCSSWEVVKYGTFRGVQRWWCKSCKRKFVDNRALPGMKTPKEQIASALNMYYEGMSLNAIRRHLQQMHNNYPSDSTVYDWITKFSKVAIKESNKIEVGLTVTTGDEGVRQLFEPGAPSIKERIKALEKLHLAGIKTYAMIAPMLPGVEELAAGLSGKVDYVLIDRMNYHYGDWVYRKHNLESTMSDSFFASRGKKLASDFAKQCIECRVLF